MEFTIPAMSCGHCVKAITQAVQQLDPKAQVIVDLQSKKVTVESMQARSALVEALAQAGYTPQ